MIAAGLTGFLTGLSLIVAIGAQNAFVLRQGILRLHVFWLVVLCAGSDAALIISGTAGFGVVVEYWPALPEIMRLGGAAFLFIYGAMRFHAAWRGETLADFVASDRGLWPTLAIGAAFTWANPHVYLDTLGLIGALSASYADLVQRWSFALGAVLASFAFFFSLGYGARLLAPVFLGSVRAWRLLDAGIGITLWIIAAYLLHLPSQLLVFY